MTVKAVKAATVGAVKMTVMAVKAATVEEAVKMTAKAVETAETVKKMAKTVETVKMPVKPLEPPRKLKLCEQCELFKRGEPCAPDHATI